jgi:hypothetical protein
MKVRDVGVCLVGGAMVYVAMAACSAGGSTTTGSHAGGGVTRLGGGGQGGGASGAGPSAGQGGDSGVFDALTNPVPSASADPTSGSRLKPKYRVADDGAKEYLAGLWYDSQRGEDCSFATAADGVERCLPQGAGFGFYGDMGCTMPIAAVQSGCAAPKYAVHTVATACGDDLGVHVYAAGAPATLTTVYAQSGHSCFAAGTASASGYTYYSVGAEVAATSFVAAATKHD